MTYEEIFNRILLVYTHPAGRSGAVAVACGTHVTRMTRVTRGRSGGMSMSDVRGRGVGSGRAAPVSPPPHTALDLQGGRSTISHEASPCVYEQAPRHRGHGRS